MAKDTTAKKKILSRKSLEVFARVQVDRPAFLWGKQKENWRSGLGIAVFDGIGSIISPGTLSALGAGRTGITIDSREELVFIFTIPTENQNADMVSVPHSIVWSWLF
jgi:hypothetical protein